MTPIEPYYQPCPSTDHELLPVVDEHDNFLRLASRQEIHACGLHHRAIHVILLDLQGRVLLQKRSNAKDSYPGRWDISVGGHVGPEETYGQTARREITEEMGYTSILPQRIAIIDPAPENGWEFIHLFFGYVDGNPSPNPDEIEDYRWEDPQEVVERADPDADDPYWCLTPSSIASFRRWWQLGAPGLPRRAAYG
ncbi:NUDIX domain-containing protein [bacterium]|nr:NUDIX domain-containing protein [bacterium]